MRRPLRSASAVLSLALVLTGCGGDKKKAAETAAPSTPSTTSAATATTEPATPSPAKSTSTPKPVAFGAVLRAAGQKAEAAGSAKFTMTMKMGAAGSMKATGVQTFTSATGRMTMDMTMGGQSLKFETLMTKSAMYMKFPKEMAGQLGGKPWVKFSYKDLEKFSGVDLEEMLSQSQSSGPGAYLKMLTAAKDTERVGTATIRGEKTTQYAGTIKPTDLSKIFTGDQRKQYHSLLKSVGAGKVKVRVWVADDGLPRRIHQIMTVSGQKMDMTMDLFDFGAKVDVTPPAASQTTDMVKLMEQSRG
jgi:hypothetical protein